MAKANNSNEVVKTDKHVAISAPNIVTVDFRIIGTAPYVQNKFSAKARQQMKEKQEAGSKAKKGTAREPKNFQECYEAAMHKTPEGWFGIPAPAFRNAMVSACRMVGFKMTHAKLSVFVEADGFDADDATPLVKITKGKPAYFESAVRNESGVCDIRARPKFVEGWEAVVRVKYDADQFSLTDISNLMMRAGMQVGIGEGRPDSKSSTGMGWGTFVLGDKK